LAGIRSSDAGLGGGTMGSSVTIPLLRWSGSDLALHLLNSK
jgi:hypothetical protein